jgi:uncharacterized protein DUF6597
MNRQSPPTVGQDSRGIIAPGLLRQRLTLNRCPTGPALAGLIEFFWTVSYRLPEGMVHSQQILPYPSVNLSVAHGQAGADARPGPLEARLTGVVRKLYTRRIAGTGWAVAAKSTPGGFGAFVAGPVADLTDRVLPLGHVLDLDEGALLAEVSAADDATAGVEVLEDRLTRLIEAGPGGPGKGGP